DAHLGVIGLVARRQHEGRLGIVELGCDRLHLRRRQSAGIDPDGERFAAEGTVSEHVDGDVAALHVLSSCKWRPQPAATPEVYRPATSLVMPLNSEHSEQSRRGSRARADSKCMSARAEVCGQYF